MADAIDLLNPNVDVDRFTGATITGWPHVVQCIGDFFMTGFGERIMREWYGSMVPRLLGENLNEQTVINFFSAVASAIEQWEPRYRIVRVTPISVDRQGKFRAEIEGEYRPRALLGDFTPEGGRKVIIAGNGETVRVGENGI